MPTGASNRGGGPGSYKGGGVQSTMNAPFKSGLNKGEQTDMSGGWSARTGGANGLPTTVNGDPKGVPHVSVPKPGFASSSPSKDMDGMKTYK